MDQQTNNGDILQSLIHSFLLCATWKLRSWQLDSYIRKINYKHSELGQTDLVFGH